MIHTSSLPVKQAENLEWTETLTDRRNAKQKKMKDAQKQTDRQTDKMTNVKKHLEMDGLSVTQNERRKEADRQTN